MEKGARLRRGNTERGRGHGSAGRMMSSVQRHPAEDGSDARVDRHQVHTNLDGRSTHRDGAGEIRPVVSIREEEGYIVRADLDGRATRVVRDDADPDTDVVETRQRGRD